jgi:hypothetical protein
VDPRFDQSNTTFLVDSQFNSTVVTGLLGFVDYQVMVNGYTIKDGPVSISYFKTEEGGKGASYTVWRAMHVFNICYFYFQCLHRLHPGSLVQM